MLSLSMSYYLIRRTTRFCLFDNTAIRCVISFDFSRNYCVKTLDEGYKPHIVELNKYKNWEASKSFNYAETKFEKRSDKVFSIILPPPNITGNLHLGHALTTTLIDVVSRWKRMCGFKVLFLPGTDHAGIATQVVVEKYLTKNNLDRQTMGKVEFERELWKWKEEHTTNIQRQLRRLGASLDWSREVFTMDPNHTAAVQNAFSRLFKLGLIYRDKRLVNWSCSLRSTISDMEVQHLEIREPTLLNLPGYRKPIKFGYIYHIAYRLSHSDEEIVVATTRPETILGDTAVAVHPDDKRYSHLVSQCVQHPLIPGKLIKIISDESVDPDFGTGAVKLTPAHDKTDFEIAQRQNIDVVSVIDENGNMYGDFKYNGLPRFSAREEILKDLTHLGLLRAKEVHPTVLPLCSRTGDVIEFLPLKQWFLKCKVITDELAKAKADGILQLLPSHHGIQWDRWLADHKDWCLSRQLWWGHGIPVWWCYQEGKPEHGKWVLGANEEDAIKEARTQYFPDVKESLLKYTPEKDVLDTWFSSGIYPFASLGWPDESKKVYQEMYPLSLLITGYDIMCLWVMRMAMLGKLLTHQLPFNKVLLHGIVTDGKGAKMSKSKGNVINPEDVITGATLQELEEKSRKLFKLGTLTEKELKTTLEENKKNFPNGIPECGVDALRLTLCEINPKNQLLSFNITKCYTNKLFGNKIWQSVRYFRGLYDLCEKHKCLGEEFDDQLALLDIWLLSRLHDLLHNVDRSLESLDYHIAVAALKQFFYDELCDFYIECTKKAVKSDLSNTANLKVLSSHCHTLAACLHAGLRCLTPFMPYVTEELIAAVPLNKNRIINTDDSLNALIFPKAENYLTWKNVDLEIKIEKCISIISIIRQLRHTFNIEYNKIEPLVHIESEDDIVKETVNSFASLITFITKCKSLEMKGESYSPDVEVSSSHRKDGFKVYIELPNTEEMIEKIKSGQTKLTKKRDKLIKDIKKLEKLTNDKKFKNTASEEAKRDHMIKINELKEDLEVIEGLRNFGL